MIHSFKSYCNIVLDDEGKNAHHYPELLYNYLQLSSIHVIQSYYNILADGDPFYPGEDNPSLSVELLALVATS